MILSNQTGYLWIPTLSIKNHWMAKANPWSQCCEGYSLSNEGIFVILLPQYFPGWIKRYLLVHFSQENTVEAGLEGNSLVKSARYWAVPVFVWPPGMEDAGIPAIFYLAKPYMEDCGFFDVFDNFIHGKKNWVVLQGIEDIGFISVLVMPSIGISMDFS